MIGIQPRVGALWTRPLSWLKKVKAESESSPMVRAMPQQKCTVLFKNLPIIGVPIKDMIPRQVANIAAAKYGSMWISASNSNGIM